jgi:serine/threonine protein kinase
MPEVFRRLGVLGYGGFAAVNLEKHMPTGKVVAVKRISKGFCVESRVKEHVLNELRIMACMDSDFVSPLFGSGQCDQNLYIVMEYMNGGDMYDSMVDNPKAFGLDAARFHSYCIALAIEHLQERSIVYRDLKPENILMRANGYPVLSDFGFAKFVVGRTFTFCGTADYLAPEVIRQTGYGFAADWWALGIFTFELARLEALFGGESVPPDVILQNVIKGLDVQLQDRPGVPPELRTVLNAFCSVDEGKRLGMRNKAKVVLAHPFFESLDGPGIQRQSVPPPFKPKLTEATDRISQEQEEALCRPFPPSEPLWDIDF